MPGWDLHPLENAALPRRTPEADIGRGLEPELSDAGLLGVMWLADQGPLERRAAVNSPMSDA